MNHSALLLLSALALLAAYLIGRLPPSPPSQPPESE